MNLRTFIDKLDFEWNRMSMGMEGDIDKFKSARIVKRAYLGE